MRDEQNKVRFSPVLIVSLVPPLLPELEEPDRELLEVDWSEPGVK